MLDILRNYFVKDESMTKDNSMHFFKLVVLTKVS